MEDLYLYESGRRVYYFGRSNGDNEGVGWHVKGKMGGLWFEDVRILSSVKLLRGEKNLIPDKFINNLYYKTLNYGKTKLNFVAHPTDYFFAIYLENLEPEDELVLYLDQTPLWLENEIYSKELKVYKKPPKTIIFRPLKQNRNISITVDNAFVHVDNGKVFFRSKMGSLLCLISMNSRNEMDFTSIVETKQDYYSKYLSEGDNDDLKFWAQLNALELYFERESGKGYVAGLPEFPWWFGIDTVYTALGLLKTPQLPLVKSSINNLAYYGNGIVPHEVTTAGRIYAKGRMNEVVSFAYLALRYVLETGEMDFLELIDKAVEILIPALDRNGYPIGEGIIEIPGTEKSALLDVACWFYKLLDELKRESLINSLKQGKELTAIFEKIERNFFGVWRNGKNLFYDAIKGDKKHFAGHFIQIYPLAMGLVPYQEGKKVLEMMKKVGFFNEIGMIHSLPLEKYDAGNYGGQDKNSIVWSLPTLLALKAAKKYADMELMDILIKSIKKSLHLGTRGALPEILPNGGCTVQAWNAYLLDIF